MPLSFKKCCPQRLSNSWCFCIKFLSSHVESSAGKYFHLMRYIEIDRFLSCSIWGFGASCNLTLEVASASARRAFCDYIHACTVASFRFIDGPADETDECTNTGVFADRLEPLWCNASILPCSKLAKPFKSCLACSWLLATWCPCKTLDPAW